MALRLELQHQLFAQSEGAGRGPWYSTALDADQPCDLGCDSSGLPFLFTPNGGSSIYDTPLVTRI